MLKLYCGQPIHGRDLTEILWPNLRAPRRQHHRWGESIFRSMQPIVVTHPDPTTADFFLLPHNYGHLKHDPLYVNAFLEQARKHQKTTIIFAPGDSDVSLHFPHTIVFRHSQYRYKLRSNEVILPAYVDDLGRERSLEFLQKRTVPSIGFCGWVTLPTTRDRLIFQSKLLYSWGCEAVLRDTHARVHRKGLWFRTQTLKVLEGSRDLVTDFIFRKSYSVNEKTRSGDQTQLRREFIDNIVHNEYTLCVKGDGNYSQRFFETLSLGRIPLFVDTECVLPLEDMIDYDTCIVTVPWYKLASLADILSAKHHTFSPEEFIAMQQRARSYYERYLRVDRFFAHTFTKEYLGRYESFL